MSKIAALIIILDTLAQQGTLDAVWIILRGKYLNNL
jgi:hypothetical protein